MEAVPAARELTGPWQREVARGAPAALHAADLLAQPVRRRVVWMEPDRPALVLGSSQPLAAANAPACARAGVEVVRRRSGGGAVLVDDGLVWVDVVLPAQDPLAAHDVGRAGWWLGTAWAEALGRLGVTGAGVHRGPMISHPWSGAVCFAGLGPGEVTVEGAKLVGVSQRRTRAGARFQCALHLAWRPDALVGLLAPPRPHPADLPPVATVAAGADEVRAAFEAVLATR